MLKKEIITAWKYYNTSFKLSSGSIIMAEEIEALFAELSNRPRREIVQELTRKGDVNSLTQFKMKLAESGRQHETFPKGEFYARRRPKGCSNYATWKNAW